jgi:hypothetical protein
MLATSTRAARVDHALALLVICSGLRTVFGSSLEIICVAFHLPSGATSRLNRWLLAS